ncbi:SAM-dependent methyltransferase [Streptomyces sp. TP-A0874]|uniref:SAM-dependent methyltransferase n=1 Tax=Streptomyces sp. TP-A0874 TaxID=549819 RepID=UPI000853D3F4|nr:SAM-dependent methyltransferase [Streptomyces sp. TP-A0874]
MTEAPIPEIDQNTPSIARAYDYMIGGKDNYAVDRAFGDQINESLPGAQAIAVENRKVLVRAIREIVTQTGIRQFVDLGSGLPTADNVHQVAQAVAPESRVVYVDNDPIVLAHGRALLDENDRTTVIQADVREPEKILEHPATRSLIDFEQPVGVVMCAILHHLNDDEDPAGIVRYWYDRVPSGSHFFISHFRTEHNPETAEIEGMLQTTFGRGRWRDDEEIRAFFDGLELLEPGVVPTAEWRPDDIEGLSLVGKTSQQRELTVWERLIVAGLARKP